VFNRRDRSTIKRKLKDHFNVNNNFKNQINVTLTQKQMLNGFPIDNIRSSQNFKHFKNKLNKKFLGNAYYRHGKSINMIVVREISPNLRHHLHCIFDRPNHVSFNEFEYHIREIWKSTNYGFDQIHIENPTEEERRVGWYYYIMKDFDENSIDWINTTIQ
jgi:hypothetical protein